MSWLPPVLFVVGIWWAATRLILVLDRMPRHTHGASLAAATAAAGGALVAIHASSGDVGAHGPYVAFASAIAVWALPELAFLTGRVTGPRRTACPAACRGGPHFGHAVEAILYNELFIAALVAIVAWLTWQAPNRIAAWTLLALWAMRTSTKLNLFFGVRNWSEGLLPDHLRYLESFFRRRPMNLLFPLSVTASTAAALALAARAADPAVSAFETAGCTLLSILVFVGVLEHWLLVLPLPVEQLFGWGIVPPRSHASADSVAGDDPAASPTPIAARRV